MKKYRWLVCTAILCLVGCAVWLKLNESVEPVSSQNLFQVIQSEYSTHEEDKQPIVILLNHSATEDRPTHQAAIFFKQRLEELSNGSIYVEVYPNDTLGNVIDNAGKFSSGSVQMRIGLGDNFPLINLCLMAPALGQISTENLDRLMAEGELRELLEQQCQKNGMKLLEILPIEKRYLVCDKYLETPEDFYSLNIRVPVEQGAGVEFWKTLGTQTTVLDIKQLRLALQQNIVNAHESTLSVVIGQRLYTYQKYLIEIPHRVYCDMILMNMDFYESLTLQQQQMVSQAAEEARTVYQEKCNEYFLANQYLLDIYGVQKVSLPVSLEELMRETVWEIEISELKSDMGEEFFSHIVEILMGNE